MNTIESKVFTSITNLLGEGPFRIGFNRLYWFDIFSSKAFCKDTDTGIVKEFLLKNFLCCAGLTIQGDIIAAGADGIAIYDDQFNKKKHLCKPPFNTKYIRFNDGKIGPDGAFWLGSMSYKGDKPVGCLYRLSKKLEPVIENMIIPNGLGWNLDENIMYVTDTEKDSITKWKFNKDTGDIYDPEIFISTKEMYGKPDGLTVDAAGNIWSAFWGGQRVCCFSPDGEQIAEIRVNAKQPTSCCFYGEKLEKLFITSAADGILGELGNNGLTFTAETGTKGRNDYKFYAQP